MLVDPEQFGALSSAVGTDPLIASRAFTCTPSDSLGAVITKLIENKSHRVYLVNDQEKVGGLRVVWYGMVWYGIVWDGLIRI